MSLLQRYNPLAWALFVAVYVPLVGPIVGTAGWGTHEFLENTRVLYRCSTLMEEGAPSLQELPEPCKEVQRKGGDELIPSSNNVAAALWNSVSFTVSVVVVDVLELAEVQLRRHAQPLLQVLVGIGVLVALISLVLPDVFDHLKFWLTRLVVTIPIVIVFNTVGALITILGQAARVYFNLVWEGRFVLAGVRGPADALMSYKGDVGSFIRDAMAEIGGIFKGVGTA